MKIKKPSLPLFIAGFILLGCASQPKPRADLRQRSSQLYSRMDQESHELVSPAPEAGKESQPKPKELPKPDFKKDSVKTVPFEEEGVWKMSKAESQIEAERRAEEEALAKALKKAGVESYYGFSDVLSEQGGETKASVARYVGTLARGVVRYERIGNPALTTLSDGSMECHVKIKGEVVFNGEPDPRFEILLNQVGGNLGLSRSVFQDGEDVEVRFLVSSAAYVYVLSVDEEQKVYLVVPNKMAQENKVSAGELFQFPPEGSGLALKAILPEGASKTTEVLHIIATKKQPLFRLEEVGEESVGPYKVLSPGKLGEVMAKLAKMKRSDWTMAVLPYQITK